MRYTCYIFSILLMGGLFNNGYSQTFNFSLTGNPVDINGWELGTMSSVENDEIVLTTPIGNQNGYVYYGTPQNLASCSEFTVEFEFRITQSSSPTADGIAFFYITNPPSGFIAGEGIGLPTNPEGLILVLDTYDNDANNNNPLISLRNMPGNVNYIESDNANKVVPDVTNQTFIADGNWHSCVLHYAFGQVTVSFDGQAPIMTGNTNVSLNGYFGFSSSTGGSWARHAIKNVHIYGASEPEKPDDATHEFCQNDPVNGPLQVVGDNLEWYTTPTGGAPLPAAPTPNTSTPGTTTYYVSEVIPHCNLESERAQIKVVVHPKAQDPIVNIPIYCSGIISTQMPIVTNSTDYQWYFNDDRTQPLDPNLIINTSTAGQHVFYVENVNENGCLSDLKEVVIPIHQTPILDFDYNQIFKCDQKDSIYITNLSQHTDHYKWFINDTFITDDVHPEFHIQYPAEHTIKLTGTNEYCKDTIQTVIETGHEFEVDFIAEPYYFCEGDVITLENISHSNVNGYTDVLARWYVDDVFKTDDWDLEILLPYTKTYDIKLKVYNILGCEKIVTKEIEIDPRMDKMYDIGDTIICAGDFIELFPNNQDKGIDYIQFDWADGTKWNRNEYIDYQHSYSSAGQYTVQVTNNFRACPTTTQEFIVNVLEVPKVQFPTWDELCLQGESIEIENLVPFNPNYKYKWSNGDTTPYTTILEPGEYQLQVSNDYCVGTESIMVESDCFVRLPNAFTPNGDDGNDYFFPRDLLSKGLIGFNMEIYNRWGQKVFETNNINGRGWDGKFNNIDQPQGVYIYQITAVFKNSRVENYTGNLTLIR